MLLSSEQEEQGMGWVLGDFPRVLISDMSEAQHPVNMKGSCNPGNPFNISNSLNYLEEGES